MESDTLNEKADDALAAAADAEPASSADGDAAAESESADTLSAELSVDEPVAVNEEETAEAVEAEIPVVVAAVADRTAELLATLARYQDEWHAEQAASRQATEQIQQELSDLTGKVALFTTTTAAMTVTIQKLADDSEQLVRWSEDVKGAGTLSKLFQVVAILVLVMLLGGMSYLALQHQQSLHHLHAAEAAVAEAIKLQQKQIAEYDKHFAVLVGTELKKEREVSSKVSVQEKLNRLRNGLAEQQLYRKTNGDWFVVTGKTEVALSDPDVIELLNQAFVKSGRALTTPYLVPPHKVITVLRPNGQGGTDIVVTKELAP